MTHPESGKPPEINMAALFAAEHNAQVASMRAKEREASYAAQRELLDTIRGQHHQDLYASGVASVVDAKLGGDRSEQLHRVTRRPITVSTLGLGLRRRQNDHESTEYRVVVDHDNGNGGVTHSYVSVGRDGIDGGPPKPRDGFTVEQLAQVRDMVDGLDTMRELGILPDLRKDFGGIGPAAITVMRGPTEMERLAELYGVADMSDDPTTSPAEDTPGAFHIKGPASQPESPRAPHGRGGDVYFAGDGEEPQRQANEKGDDRDSGRGGESR